MRLEHCPHCAVAIDIEDHWSGREEFFFNCPRCDKAIYGRTVVEPTFELLKPAEPTGLPTLLDMCGTLKQKD